MFRYFFGRQYAVLLTGTVSTAANTVNYNAENIKLTHVDLAKWDGTTGALPSGWTPKTNIPVTAEGFVALAESMKTMMERNK